MANNDEKSGEKVEKIKKVIFNEVTALVAVISIVIGVMNWVQDPQIDMAEGISSIKSELSSHEDLQTQYQNSINNQLETIRTGDFKDFKADLLENRDMIVQLQQQTVKLQTIIEERIPATKK